MVFPADVINFIQNLCQNTVRQFTDLFYVLKYIKEKGCVLVQNAIAFIFECCMSFTALKLRLCGLNVWLNLTTQTIYGGPVAIATGDGAILCLFPQNSGGRAGKQMNSPFLCLCIYPYQRRINMESVAYSLILTVCMAYEPVEMKSGDSGGRREGREVISVTSFTTGSGLLY